MLKLKLFRYLVFILLITESFCDVMLSDEEYFQMPDLFALDNYDRCMSRADGVYCMGRFGLRSSTSNHIYNLIKRISESPHNFNHTNIYRGVCLGSEDCPLNSSITRERMFQDCVDNQIKKHYGLEAYLDKLDYCRSRDDVRPWDGYDYMFLVYAAVILALNVGATYYDVSIRDKNSEGNRWILCFSLSANWKSFKGGHTGGKNTQTRFPCLDGLRAVLSIFVIVVHTPMTMIFSANPRFLENISTAPAYVILANSTVAIQTFFVISNFLQAFKILTDSEKSELGLKTVLQSTVDRFIRISPLFVKAVAIAATLAARANDGPLWGRCVQAEADACRQTFWRQFFLLQSWYPPGCLPQAWYISVDFQLYVICTAILVYCLKKKTYVIEKLVAIFISSILVLFAIIYSLELKPSLQTFTLEAILDLFQEAKSFIFLYQSLWGNFPAAILGTLAAYLYYTASQQNIDLKESKWLKTAFRMTIPAMAVFSLVGCLVHQRMTSRITVSLYATLDKPGWAIVILVFIFGCLFQVEHVYRRAAEWAGWTPWSRLTLSSLLFHSTIARLIISTKLYPHTFTWTDAMFNWFSLSVGTLVVCLPLHLMIEQPFMRLYQNIKKFSKTKKEENENKIVANGNGVVAKSQLNGRSQNGVTKFKEN